VTGSPAGAKPALVYCRVSTRGQEEDGTSLDSQEAACRAYATEHGYTVAYVTREVESARELWNRALLTRDREALRTGRYAALICYDLDRLARNPVHQALIIEECSRHDVALEIVLAPLDTSPEGMLIAYVRGYAAQIEREKIRERSLRGKRYRAASGKIHNSGIDLYGYRRDREAGVRVIYEPEAAIVRRIYEWIAVERIGTQAVARRLTEAGVPPPSVGKRATRAGKAPEWTRTQIRLMLHNPAYKGVSVAWQQEAATMAKRRAGVTRGATGRLEKPAEEQIPLPDGVTPPLVSPELWQAALDAVAERAARLKQRNAARFSLLRGLIWCARCGRRMDISREHRHQRVPTFRYRCASRNTMAGRCGSKDIRAERVEEWVWERMEALIRDPDSALADATRHHAADGGEGTAGGASIGQAQRERERAAAAITRIEARQAEMLRRFGDSADNAAFPWELVEKEVSRLEREKRQWQATLTELDARLTEQATTQAWAVEARERLAQLRPLLDDAVMPAVRRGILESFDVRVYVDDGDSGAQWRMVVDYPVETDGGWARGVEFTT